MTDRLARLILFATVVVLLTMPVGHAASSEGSIPVFPYEHGWLGADAAFSIPLDEGKSLWLLGDTFVGAPGARTRTPRTDMPRNSIAISECAGHRCTVKYFWNRMYQPGARAFFDISGPDWFWPLDGFIDHGSLYVMLEEMHAVGTGAFGFGFSGVTLATIGNYLDSPERWKIRYQKVVSGDAAIPGVSIVAGRPGFNPYPRDPKGDGWVYFFTVRKLAQGKSVMALTRLARADLAHAGQAAGKWQYLSASQGWLPWTTPGTLTANAKTVLDDGYTEFTVRYHPERRQWLAVAPARALTDNRAVYSLAPSLDGPWSQPQTLLEYPEMKKTNPDYTAKVFCYAAKEHLEFEMPGSIVFTYVCNSLVEDEIFRNMNLYHPVVVVQHAPEQ